MADKRFHMTPSGPEQCRAKYTPCLIEDHYASLELAASGSAVKQRNNVHRSEITRLEGLLRNCPPELFSRTAFNTLPNNDSTRQFGREMDARIDNLGVKPEVYHSATAFRLYNGNGTEVTVRIYAMPIIDEGFARIIPEWRFLVTSNDLGMHLTPKTQVDEIFDFSTTSAIRASMPKVTALFRTAIISSGIYDDDEIDRRAADMLAHFKAMFNAVESEAVGDFDVWDRAMGYFTESDAETIVVNEDYKTSAFRAENFLQFITSNPYYRSELPAAEIRVSDAHGRTGASWTLKRESGQWSVEKVFTDGSSEVAGVSTPQEALDHVYYHVLAHINPNDEERALEKARYAAELVQGVESSLERQKDAVDEWWRKEEARKEAFALQRNEKPKPTLLGRIFGTSS